MSPLAEDIRAVLLPICDILVPPEWLRQHLSEGGRTVLMASSAEEYDARRIGDRRRTVETAGQIHAFSQSVAAVAGRRVLVAVDAEPSGVQRLEHLLPDLPGRPDLQAMGDDALVETFMRYASQARALGIGLFLSPVVDQIRGANEWLQGRIMAENLEQIARIGAAYVRAVQSVGVTATAKHFPGYSDLAANPARHVVDLLVSREEVERNLAPFRTLVDAGVGAVMVGPTAVRALDPVQPAGLSSDVVSLLRSDLGFAGLVISDDLGAMSTLRGRSLAQVAVESLAAGVELLLVPGGDAVGECSSSIEAAIARGVLDQQVVATAAAKVRRLTD